MTDDAENILDEIFTHAKLVELVNRALSDADTPLEFGMCGMVFMLYPSRVFALSQRERIKHFIAFVLTLSALVQYNNLTFSLRALDDELEIGVTRSGIRDGENQTLWVPCQIARIDANVTQPVMILPREPEEREPERVLLRKIEL